MKIKEVQAGVKIVKNYNSYSVSLTADVDGNENEKEVGEELIKMAEKIIKQNLGDEELIEVGAAWPHKKSENFLSVKLNDDDNYCDVRIQDLEETTNGFKQKTQKGVLIYKKVEKRKSDKMPIYRIYKEVKNE